MPLNTRYVFSRSLASHMPNGKNQGQCFFFSFDWPSYEPRHLQTWKNSKIDAKLNLMCPKTTICNEVIITHYLDFQTPSPINFPYTKINSNDFFSSCDWSGYWPRHIQTRNQNKIGTKVQLMYPNITIG